MRSMMRFIFSSLFECYKYTLSVLFVDLCSFPRERILLPRRSSTRGGFCFPVHVGLKLRHALIDLLDCALAGVAVLFLKQTSENIELTSGPFQIVVGEFAPPRFGLASDLFPLAFEYIFVHWILLGTNQKSCPTLCR